MNLNFKYLVKVSFLSVFAVSLFSCSSDDSSGDPDIVDPDPSSLRPYHLVLGSSSTGNSATYTQGVTVEQLIDPAVTFSFEGFGFEVPSTRTARVYTSDDGETLFNLNYGGGAVAKYDYESGQNYGLVSNTDIQAVMGTAYPRWTKIDENFAVLQNVITDHVYSDEEGTVYERTSAMVTLALMDLRTMTVVENNTFEFPWNEEEASEGVFVFRIDAPVLSNGKLYYGAAKRVYNPLTAENESLVYEDIETLVVDYPSLNNETTIRTSVDGVAGSTNGYRTPVAHMDEKNDTYQLVTSGDASIVKISNGSYDEAYGSFNIKEILGHNAEANTGWFYVGNGIGYVPVLNTDLGESASSYWDVVRVDVYNKTAVKMNIPLDLWLRQYQWASVIEGKLFMALAPLGGEGNVYIFDPTSTDATGYEVGAKLKTGTDASYIGLF
ncbi:hypothetical protein [Joostella sp.]|uniref:hypothetical protein n=1 Tax=Joostella sp. TaxID=2231138 RepID=UPI003A94E117